MYIILIYLLYYNLNPVTAGSTRINAKEREEEAKTSEKSEEKRYRGTEGEASVSNPGN